jgi:AraC-like DNA-binding protein
MLCTLQPVHLAKTALYSSKELPRLLRVSPRQIQRKFRQELGLSPQKWLNAERIRVAKELLLTGLQVKRVAYQLNFKQVSHFSAHFKKYTGSTPSEFRHDRHRESVDNVAEK